MRDHRAPLAAGAFGAVLLLASGCGLFDSGPDPSGPGADPSDASEKDDALSGLALLHRGYQGGDPSADQMLVFHDPQNGDERSAVELPEDAVDPVMTGVPVRGRFTADWRRFAYAPFETPGVHIATLSEDGSAYTDEVELTPSEGEKWSAPEFHGGRLWFSAQQGGEGGPARVLSVPVDSPQQQPREEAELPLNEIGQPDLWRLDPDGDLYVPISAEERQIGSESFDNLRFKRSGEHVMEARRTVGEAHWSSFDNAPAWGGSTVPVGSEEGGVEGAGSVYFLEIDDDGGGYSDDRVFEFPSVPRQAAPSPDRSRLLVHDETAWYSVDPTAEPGPAKQLFDIVSDGSREGYPLVAGWA